MAVKITTVNHKNDATIVALANQTIPDEISVGMSRDQFKSLIANDVPVDGFIGSVEVLKTVLDENVPITFPNRTLEDGDGNETILTWRDYSIFHENETHALMHVGCRDKNGNRTDIVGDTELRIWVAYFGVDNLLTRSETLHKIDSDYANLS